MEDRTTVCCFDCGEECAALRVKKCENCKFFKTEAEYKYSYERAARLLRSKGLEPYRTSYGIMTTRKIEVDPYGDN